MRCEAPHRRGKRFRSQEGPWQAVEYQVVLEFDADTRHYTASVPGLPIMVDSTNKRTAIKLAREAISLYLEETGVDAPAVHTELVTVKV